MKPKYLFALLLSTLLFVGCDQQSRHHYRPLMATKEEVKIYKVRRTNSVPVTVTKDGFALHMQPASSSDDNMAWLYWYIIYDSNTRSYYSASSQTPATSYSSLSWSKSPTPPTIAEAEEEVVPVETVEVATPDLGQAATEISADYSSIPEVNSLDSMEGVPSNDTGPTDSGGTSDGGGSSGGDSGGGGDGGGGN